MFEPNYLFHHPKIIQIIIIFLYRNSILHTYRIYSRLFCNFVVPKSYIRPMSNGKGKIEEEEDKDKDKEDDDDNVLVVEKESYAKEINKLAKELSKTTLFDLDKIGNSSPKFLKIYENIVNKKHIGLHLLYSQFRSFEGIELFTLMLKHHGFVELRVKFIDGHWLIDLHPDDMLKPKYGLFTGTETSEEKDIVRNIFNGDWNLTPVSIQDQLLKTGQNNNLYGEICKVLMITASGAEGINLRNTRYVHIMEPYWHLVRLDQVIGRARRICSHRDLPVALRTVEVFIYIATLTKKQINGEGSMELRINDLSKETKQPITSDEYLFEISNRKDKINNQLLRAVKESAVDCFIFQPSSTEGLKCWKPPSTTPDVYTFVPDISKQPDDRMEKINEKIITWVAQPIEIDGIKYMIRILDKDSKNNIMEFVKYNYDEFIQAKKQNRISQLEPEGIYERKTATENFTLKT